MQILPEILQSLHLTASAIWKLVSLIWLCMLVHHCKQVIGRYASYQMGSHFYFYFYLILTLRVAFQPCRSSS